MDYFVKEQNWKVTTENLLSDWQSVYQINIVIYHQPQGLLHTRTYSHSLHLTAIRLVEVMQKYTIGSHSRLYWQ